MSIGERDNSLPLTWKRKRGWFFYLFFIPLFFAVIFALFSLNVKALLLNSTAFVLMYATFLLARRGFAQEEAYNEATLTKAPKTPFKLIAALLLMFSVFYAAYIAGNYTLFNSLFLSVTALVGFFLYYGFDPKKDKLKDFGDISSELVLQTLTETREKIETITQEANRIEDRPLYNKVDAAIQRSNTILNALVEDPKDIRVARKFLVVYLDGVADVVTSYNAVEEEHISRETREKLLELMEEVEKRFQKELERLRNNNLFDLDVNIDTLKEQIKH